MGPFLLKAVYRPADGGGIRAHVAELPEVAVTAPTRAEAEKFLLEALREHLLALDRPRRGPGEDETLVVRLPD